MTGPKRWLIIFLLWLFTAGGGVVIIKLTEHLPLWAQELLVLVFLANILTFSYYVYRWMENSDS